MRKLFLMLLSVSAVLLLITSESCKRDGNGSYKYFVRFTAEPPPGVQTWSETYYTGLGTYVTSLTPSKFIVKLGMLGFQDDTTQCPGSYTDILQFVDGNYSQDDSIRIADFSANIQREYQPKLYGRTESNAWFTDPEISFTYFYFNLFGGRDNEYIFNEIVLPEEYRGMKLMQFEGKNYGGVPYWNDSVNRNNVLRIQYHSLTYYAFNSINTKTPTSFIFGNTDSTFIFNPYGTVQPISKNHIFCGETRESSIRSNRYSPVKLSRPKPDEVLVMKAIVSFNTDKLVQVYSGPDAKPFTEDDIFVYAPQFWERIQVVVENQ